MRHNNKRWLSLAFMATATAATWATPLEFCYSDLSETPDTYGTGRPEMYEVAIKVEDPGLVGSRIIGLKVPFESLTDISSPKGWLTSELKITTVDGKKVTIPDSGIADMKLENGYLTCTFDTPYEITSDGIYAGYSFTVDKVTEGTNTLEPLAVSHKVFEHGMYIHTSKKFLKWRNVSDEMKMSSYLTVLIEGNFTDVSAGIEVKQNLYFKTGEPYFTVPVELTSHSAGEVNKIIYEYAIGDRTGEVTVNYDKPLAIQFGHNTPATVDIPETFTEKGEYTGTLTIKQVNEILNTDVARTGQLSFEMLSRVPVHKPVMEEYTGFWCGFCPRGFASMEHMRHNFPDTFIGIAYHSGDQLGTVSQLDFPSKVTGFPTAYLDRAQMIDAYHGTAGVGYGFKDDWIAKRDKFTPVDVHVTAAYDETNQNLIRVNSEVTIVKDINTGFKVAFVLLADGMSHPLWEQANNYAGNLAYKDIPEMDVFTQAKGPVKNLVFNDVIVQHSNLKGIDDTVPWPVEVDKPCTQTFTFDVSKIDSALVPYKRDQMRVAVLVIDSFNEIANADACEVTGDAAVSGISDTTDIVATEYFDLQGRRVISPAAGIFIKVDTLRGGEKRSSKIVIK